MYVEVTLPDTSVKKFTINGKSAVLGRSKKVDIPIEVEGISRQHMQIVYENDTFYVVDLKSTNGVYLNNEKIPPEKKVKYLSILPLRVGPLTISIKSEEEVAQEEDEKLMVSSSMSSSSQGNIGSINSQRGEVSKTARAPRERPIKTKKFNPMNLLVLLGIGGSIYFFNQKKEEEQIAVEQQKVDVKKEAQKEKIVRVTLIDSVEIRKHALSASCVPTEVAPYCKLIGRDMLKNEGVVLVKDTLLIFLTLEGLNKKSVAAKFNELPENKRLQSLLIDEALFPSMLEEAKKQGIAMIQAIAVQNDYDMLSIKASVGVSTDASIKMSNNDFHGILSYILQAADFKYFDRFLGKHYNSN